MCHGLLSALPDDAINRVYDVLSAEYKCCFGQEAASQLAEYNGILEALGPNESSSVLIEPDQAINLSPDERAKMGHARSGIHTSFEPV